MNIATIQKYIGLPLVYRDRYDDDGAVVPVTVTSITVEITGDAAHAEVRATTRSGETVIADLDEVYLDAGAAMDAERGGSLAAALEEEHAFDDVKDEDCNLLRAVEDLWQTRPHIVRAMFYQSFGAAP